MAHATNGEPMELIDRVKKYWDDRPCNIRHSSRPQGTKEYFDAVEARKHFVEPHILDFAQFDLWKHRKVLEVGCGIGTALVNFARAGAHVTGVDLSGQSLKLAAERVKIFGLQDRVKLYQANVENLADEIPLETYDLVYSFGVIHHTPRPDVALLNMREFMHEQSELRLMLYHRYSWKVFEMLVRNPSKFRDLDALIAYNSEAQEGCPVTHSYTKKTAWRLLRRMRFYVKQMYVRHIFPYSIPEYREGKYVKRPIFRYMPPWFFGRVEQILGWHLCIIGEAE